MTVFSVIVVMLMQQMSSSIVGINQGQSEENSPEQLLGILQFTLIEPTSGYTVTTADTSQYMVHPKDAPFVFNDTIHHNDHKYVQIIRDSHINPREANIWSQYKDFISVQRQTGDMIGWGTKWQGTAISLQDVVAHFNWHTNTSVISFGMGDTNDTLFVHLAANDTSLIWANNYTIYYGYYDLRTTNVDLWGTIRMVLLMQIPGLDPTIQFLISGIWTFSMIFIGFTLISRIIPLVGGG
jgi:hypothetical protein